MREFENINAVLKLVKPEEVIETTMSRVLIQTEVDGEQLTFKLALNSVGFEQNLQEYLYNGENKTKRKEKDLYGIYQPTYYTPVGYDLSVIGYVGGIEFIPLKEQEFNLDLADSTEPLPIGSDLYDNLLFKNKIAYNHEGKLVWIEDLNLSLNEYMNEKYRKAIEHKDWDTQSKLLDYNYLNVEMKLEDTTIKDKVLAPLVEHLQDLKTRNTQ